MIANVDRAGRAAAYRLPYTLCHAIAGDGVSVKESAKLRPDRLERRRYYLRFTHDAQAGVLRSFREIARALHMPAAARALVAPWLPVASDVSLGAAIEDGVVAYRLYAAKNVAASRDTWQAAGIGIAWVPGRDRIQVKDYALRPAMERERIRAEVLRALGFANDPSGARLVDLGLAIAGLGEGFTETFRVTERESRRVSFDFRVVAEDTRIVRLAREVRALATHLGTPRRDVRRWMAECAAESVDRLSIGVDREGCATATLYHGARWTEPRFDDGPPLLPGIGEVTVNPWFDDRLPKIFAIGTLSRHEAMRFVMARDGVATHFIAPLPSQLASLGAFPDVADCAIAGWIARHDWLGDALLPLVVPAAPPLLLPEANEVVARYACEGESPASRASNFALTHAARFGLKREERDLAPACVAVDRTPVCAPRRDCWDVTVEWFSPPRRCAEALRAWRVTVDVSDAVPVLVGPVRRWSVSR